MIYPENFEEKTGFYRIREWIKELCLCTLGKDAVDEMKFLTNYDLINSQLTLVNEMKEICLNEDSFPVDNFHDVRDALKKIKIEGTYLDEREIFEIGRSLDVIRKIIAFFKNNREKYPELNKIARKVSIFPFISQRIEAILTSNGKIKNNASPGLKEVRNSIKTKENEVSRKIHQIFKGAQASGIISDDASIVIRDGRPVIPVEASNKRMIKGYIHDESSTGKTVFIEPAEVFELNNELRELGYAEKREIIKILIAFTSEIRPYRKDLINSYEFLKEIDFIRAKALFSLKIPAIKPVLHNRPFISWNEALHPILYLTHRADNKTIVPLDIKLNHNKRIILISGPNAGGKSVCLKTTGLIQYMLQCGMLVPMHFSSEAGIFDHIFIDIGDEQSIENDLSTYSSHLLNMKYFLKNSGDKTLLLIDEFGSGTEPNIGGAIAEAILQQLNENKTFGVITTHYSNLKHFASSAEGIVNGAMLYDTQKMQPLFKLHIGGPGSSFAFEIARNIGIPENILNSASDKIGSEHIEFDKHLREVLRDKRYWERKRENIRKIEKQLELKNDKYSVEIENINKTRKELLLKTRQEADNILLELNKKIENTIRAIKESNADKEKTKTARQELDGFVNEMKEKLKPDNNLKNKNLIKNKKDSKLKDKNNIIPQEFYVGCKVKMKDQDLPGEIIEIQKNSISVTFGNIVTSCHPDKLEIISEKEYKKHNPDKGVIITSKTDTYSKKLNFKPNIDLRGKRAEEALRELHIFLDDAIMVSANELRILHGKGNGILKEVIRDYLRTQDVVKSVKDEHVERGGSGITIVKLVN